MFHVKRRSLLHGIISRGRAAAPIRSLKQPLGRAAELSTETDSSTEARASLVHEPESMAGSVHREPEVEESEPLRSDANLAGPMADPVPGPRTESAGEDVSRETLPPMDDTPIGRAAQMAMEAMGRSGTRLPRPVQKRVMVVANQKGGVGKTTTTVNLAASLALHGARVLVIDLDPQGNASTALGIDHHAEVPSIYDVLVESKPLAEVVQPVPDVEGLFCAPATIDLAGAEIELVSLVARESRLQRAIQAYEQPLDYILIDCPPSLGLLTVNAMVAGAEVLIPIQCEYYALEGLGQLLRNVDLVRGHLNPTLHVSTILLTMYDGRTRLASQVAEEVRSHFGEEVLRTSIPRSVRISEAPSYGQTVLTYDPGSSGALSYLEAAREIALRGVGVHYDPQHAHMGHQNSQRNISEGIQ
ncbi:Partitioning or sporulation protein [Streptomyces clavuligerus]|uniref:Partitioning or sporulation protein n=2 Tax=Streptomyces clavuligerus TaxID=1901 RepID=E2PVR1_STRCL|nr:Partitioning or sporulation protein [Streptomyces clavuligerus]